MKNIFATMAVAALAAWAAPASAGTIYTDPGEILSQSNPFFERDFDLTGIFGAKLSFYTDGIGKLEPCDDPSFKKDCFGVFVNNVYIDGLLPQPLSVPNSKTLWKTAIGVDDTYVTLRFEGDLSSRREGFDVSNIKVGTHTVSEPAPLALFGIGLAGLGFMRRKRSA